MPVQTDLRPKPTARQVRCQGAFLTDGERLFRVLPMAPDQPTGTVWLEDCAHPEWYGTEHRVAEVGKTMRLVRYERVDHRDLIEGLLGG